MCLPYTLATILTVIVVQESTDVFLMCNLKWMAQTQWQWGMLLAHMKWFGKGKTKKSKSHLAQWYFWRIAVFDLLFIEQHTLSLTIHSCSFRFYFYVWSLSILPHGNLVSLLLCFFVCLAVCCACRPSAPAAAPAPAPVTSTVTNIAAAPAKPSYVVQGEFSIDLDVPELTVNAGVVPPVQLTTVDDFDELMKPFTLPQDLQQR